MTGKEGLRTRVAEFVFGRLNAILYLDSRLEGYESEIISFLNKNRDRYFSISELATMVGLTSKTTGETITSLENKGRRFTELFYVWKPTVGLVETKEGISHSKLVRLSWFGIDYCDEASVVDPLVFQTIYLSKLEKMNQKEKENVIRLLETKHFENITDENSRSFYFEVKRKLTGNEDVKVIQDDPRRKKAKNNFARGG